MFTRSTIFLVLLLILLALGKISGQEDKSSGKKQARIQGRAIRAWAKTLTNQDYDASYWSDTFHQQPSNFFEHYVEKFSNVFNQVGAMVNFVMIGACDGTHDRTISDRFVPNAHWRGVFVEPFEINHNDLVQFMTSKGVLNRATILRAAATFRCNDTTIKMKRPTFEEKNKSLPHWMRREIGSIVPFDKLNRPATGGWIFEYVPCVNGQKILQNWTYALNLASPSDAPGENRVRLRPHVLKVDVEGHDYEVLMGFLHDGIPSAALPMLISFEAKSILKDFDRLKGHLEKRGYAVSHLANDGFALLKGDHILSSGGKASVSSSAEENKEILEVEEDVEGMTANAGGNDEGEENEGDNDAPKRRRKKNKNKGNSKKNRKNRKKNNKRRNND